MLEAAWSTVHGWFTPAVLFLLINLVVGTIALASRSSGDDERRASAALLRAPSAAFDRIRSFGFSRHAAPHPFDGGATEDEQYRGSALLRAPSVVFDRLRSFGSFSRSRAEDRASPAPEPFDEPAEPLAEQEQEHEEAHMERSRSEAAGAGEAAPRLPARLRKSASERSAFAHFAQEEEGEDAEQVEARRPATTREAAAGAGGYDDGEDEDDDEGSKSPVEVDERADNFINQFREQLRLQRLDSFKRYRDVLRRGQQAATG